MIPIVLPIYALTLLMTPLSTSALTTFGKTNPQTQNQPATSSTRVGTARDCKMDADCSAIQNTTCLPDRLRDEKTRCLCGDYTAPINGRCDNKGKAVHVPCNDHSECHDGAECIEKANMPAGKQCYCKEGYWEERFKCNGAETILRHSTIALMTVALCFLQGVGYSQ